LTIEDLRLALAAMAAPDVRDPWWTPAPLEGPPVPRLAALCLRPEGLQISPEVQTALIEAGRRLTAAGWRVESVEQLPPLREPAALQIRLWFGEQYRALVDAAEREGDRGAINVLASHAAAIGSLTLADISTTFLRRATLARAWGLFFAQYPVVLLPVSAEPPFAFDLDLEGPTAFARVWEAQLPMIAPPFVGLPGLTVSMPGVAGRLGGAQLLAARFREDLCLLAGEAIAAAGPPITAVDPV
jgi:amidase